MRLDGALLFEVLLDGLGQLLAQFNAPLIVGVDVPDDALHEDLVLVEGDQGAESERGQDRQHDRGRRAVALEYLQGRELEIHNHSNFEV